MSDRFFTEAKPFTRTGTTTGTSLTDIGNPIINAAVFSDLFFEVINGSTTLTDFALLIKIHPDSDWVTLMSAADWDTITGILVHKEGTIKTLANGATGIARVNLGPIHAFKFQASVGSSTTTPVIRGMLYR